MRVCVHVCTRVHTCLVSLKVHTSFGWLVFVVLSNTLTFLHLPRVVLRSPPQSHSFSSLLVGFLSLSPRRTPTYPHTHMLLSVFASVRFAYSWKNLSLFALSSILFSSPSHSVILRSSSPLSFLLPLSFSFAFSFSLPVLSATQALSSFMDCPERVNAFSLNMPEYM